MSFRSITERIARIARATAGSGRRRGSGSEELRKAQELIDVERAREESARRKKEQARRAGQASKAMPAPDPALVDALALLGLRPGAAFTEVSAAYRTRIAAAHPDRSRGDARLATEETQRLNAAYSFLRKHYGR